jgi:SSS family solute:Na+ symporter
VASSVARAIAGCSPPASKGSRRNLGAIEILGVAASSARYGVAVVHYYWIAAVPAMVFLGIVMMPFYYGSRVRSVPETEYLRRRFDRKTHLVTALIFVASSVLSPG